MTLILFIPRTVSATFLRRVAFVRPVVRQRLSSGYHHHASNTLLQKNDNEYTITTKVVESSISSSTSMIPVSSSSLPPRDQCDDRSRPFSWSELQQIIIEDHDLAKLARSVEQEETYRRFRHELLQEYASVYDHILHSKFGYPKRLNDKTPQRWETYPRPQQEQGEPQPILVHVVLVPNDFPYYTEAGIEHWVLWKLHEHIKQDDIKQAKEDLRQRFVGDDVDLIHWENPPHLKSLPDIDQVHILVQRQRRRCIQ
jgi:hypothetical protein